MKECEMSSAKQSGIRYWKVRIITHGGRIRALSRTEPVVILNANGGVSNVEMDLMATCMDGDAIGYIDWSSVCAVTWRPEPDRSAGFDAYLERQRAALYDLGEGFTIPKPKGDY